MGSIGGLEGSVRERAGMAKEWMGRWSRALRVATIPAWPLPREYLRRVLGRKKRIFRRRREQRRKVQR